MFEKFKIKTLCLFGEFGFCRIRKEKDESQQGREKEEKTANPIKVT